MMPMLHLRPWRFVLAVSTRAADGRMGLIAAGVAFYAMFAVFPGLGAVVAIWGMVADPAVIPRYLDQTSHLLPPEAHELIRDQVMGLVNAPRAALGWTTFASLAVALYSARNGVAALIGGLDVVHQAERRGWLAGLVREVAVTLALMGALLASLATVVLVPVLLAHVPLGGLGAWLLRYLPWAVMFATVLVCLAIVYRLGPNLPPDTPRRWLSAGVIFTALAWAGVSIAFSAYLAHFNSYNRIYGSIGAAIILMMWLYLSVWAVLAGGAINAELAASARLRRQMGRR